jgi:predicted ferric reductase
MSIIGVKVLIGSLFFLFSSLAFVSMLHMLGAPHTPHAKALRMIHRAAGMIAIILYIVVAVMCIVIDVRQAGDLSPRAAAHFLFAVLFIPLIVLKVLIVEKYPELRNRLLAIGSILFAVIFVIFATSSAFYLVRAVGKVPGEIKPRIGEDLTFEKELFVVKCSKCHRLDKPLSARKTSEQWQQSVETMRQKDVTWISPEEASRITRFLIALEGQQ